MRWAGARPSHHCFNHRDFALLGCCPQLQTLLAWRAPQQNKGGALLLRREAQGGCLDMGKEPFKATLRVHFLQPLTAAPFEGPAITSHLSLGNSSDKLPKRFKRRIQGREATSIYRPVRLYVSHSTSPSQKL